MKKTFVSKSAWAVLAICATVSSVAYAGYTIALPVTVNVAGGFAEGSQVTARNSLDKKQAIGCSILAQVGQPLLLNCYAQNSVGTNANCQSSDPGLIAVAQTITSHSSLQFGWQGSTCNALSVDNGSQYE